MWGGGGAAPLPLADTWSFFRPLEQYVLSCDLGEANLSAQGQDLIPRSLRRGIASINQRGRQTSENGLNIRGVTVLYGAAVGC